MNWVDTGEELKAELLAEVSGGLDEKKEVVSALKQAWREDGVVVR